MAPLTSVPAWVHQPARAVCAVEDVTLRHYGRTKAPAALGAWSALRWLGEAPETLTPVSKLRRDPTETAALIEVVIAGRVAVGGAYPDAQWWAQQRVAPDEAIGQKDWDDLATHGYGQELALGVSHAFAWLVGLKNDVTCMLPRRNGDGIWFSPQIRAQLGAELAGAAAAETSRVVK